MSTTFYDSRKNIMKRDSISGMEILPAPTALSYSGYIYTTDIVIPHNLGYVPLFRYYYEPFGDGIIYPQLVSRLGQFSNNPLNPVQKGPGIIAWADNTLLHIQIFFDTNGLGRTTPVYYVIYRDFELPDVA